MRTMLAPLLLLVSRPSCAEELWPDLSSPPKAMGGGERDAALIVGAENYAFVAKVPGARQNAEDWQAYLTDTLKVPSDKVTLLRDNEATVEKLRKYAAKAAGEVKSGGTLWFVFIGHGAPSQDGQDGLLVGADAQQDADSLYARSLPRNELLGYLSKGNQAKTLVLVDACFSGRSFDGAPLVKGLQPLITMARTPGAMDNRTILMTAAKADQFAGPLPKSGKARPAFSYLALGALRGWAADAEGKVTASGIVDFARRALSLARDRTQTPELSAGAEGTVLGVGREASPNLARIDREGKAGAIEFKVSSLPEVPKANAPTAAGYGGVPRARMPGEIGSAEGIDFSSVDVDALEKYDAVAKFEKSDAQAEAKSAKWRELGREVKTYADLARERAAAWDDYAAEAAFSVAAEKEKGDLGPEEKQAAWLELGGKYPKYAQTAKERAREWERYAQELAAAEEARARRAEIRDKDWAKLSRLLALSVVGEADKRKFAATFVNAYGKKAQDNPYLGELLPLLPEGTLSPAEIRAAKAGAQAPKPKAAAGKGGIQWVSIPGGAFSMGQGGDAHQVTIKSFQIAKTEVTAAQYKACVEAGKCTALDAGSSCTWGIAGKEDHPVNCVDWTQAKAFSEWVGGRLPSEAEWEYAARSAGKDRKYPWGNEDATCERAVISDGGLGCGKNSTWPACSKTRGNSEQGLCDMAGNVWEWVQDRYHSPYSGAPTDGSAWENPAGSARVIRGGSWNFDVGNARSAYRDYYVPGSRTRYLGFRPAR